MTGLNELTRGLQRWFAEHAIPPEGFTLILNFRDADAGIRFDYVLRQEIEQASLSVRGGVPVRMMQAQSRLAMNGVEIRIESPVHEIGP